MEKTVRKVTDVKHGGAHKQVHAFSELKKELMMGLVNARQARVCDVECDPYIDMINALPQYMTSSSCYGRIALMYVPNDEKLKQTIFVDKWHREVTVDEVWRKIMMCTTSEEPCKTSEEPCKTSEVVDKSAQLDIGHTPSFAPLVIPSEIQQKGEIWLRMDPMIIHISCDSIESANDLIRIKTESGIRRGGIFNIKPGRVQIVLEGTQSLALPVIIDGTLCVSRDYLENIVKISNLKMKRNDDLWRKFAAFFCKTFPSTSCTLISTAVHHDDDDDTTASATAIV